jgi:methyl-accepting chemotaxis protein
MVLIIWLMLALAWAGMIWWASMEQRRIAIEQSKDFARSVHQMTMASLLFMKVTKTIKKRALYLDQVKQSSGVNELHIIRGPVVEKQFGDPLEGSPKPDETEQQVLRDGQEVFRLKQDADGREIMEVVIPAVNVRKYLGQNCMECHDEAPENAILGVVSMNISLQKPNQMVAMARMKLIGAAVVITIPLLLFIYLFITRSVCRPMQAMADGLRDISQGEGDLTRRLPVNGQDEIGRTATEFNHMMDKLLELIRTVSTSAGQVSGAALALNRETTAINADSAAQSEQSASAASAVEEMAVSISSVAASSDEVKVLSEQSLHATQKGMSHLKDLGDRLAQVEEAVGRITHTVHHFVSSTASISAMTQQVKEIAEQTNLLALNAAIEAARAGEYGRGFAVVADEVRKLAEKSGHSASEIDAITQQLGQESGNVKAAIDLGLEVLRQSKAAMESVARVIDEANQAVVEVAKGMNAINNATDEQQQTSALVARNVESIAELAEKNRHAIENVANAANNLTALAESLQQEMGKFRT